MLHFIENELSTSEYDKITREKGIQGIIGNLRKGVGLEGYELSSPVEDGVYDGVKFNDGYNVGLVNMSTWRRGFLLKANTTKKKQRRDSADLFEWNGVNWVKRISTELRHTKMQDGVNSRFANYERASPIQACNVNEFEDYYLRISEKEPIPYKTTFRGEVGARPFKRYLKWLAGISTNTLLEQTAPEEEFIVLNGDDKYELKKGIYRQYMQEDQSRAIGLRGHLLVGFLNSMMLKGERRQWALGWIYYACKLINEWKICSRLSVIKTLSSSSNFCVVQNVTYAITAAIWICQGLRDLRFEEPRLWLYLLSKGDVINFFVKYRSVLKDESALGSGLNDKSGTIVNYASYGEGDFVECGQRKINVHDQAYNTIDRSEIWESDLYQSLIGQKFKAFLIAEYNRNKWDIHAGESVSSLLQIGNCGLYLKGTPLAFWRNQAIRDGAIKDGKEGLPWVTLPECQIIDGIMRNVQWDESSWLYAYYTELKRMTETYSREISVGEAAVSHFIDWLTFQSDGKETYSDETAIVRGKTRVSSMLTYGKNYANESDFRALLQRTSTVAFRDQIARPSRTVWMVPNEQQFLTMIPYEIMTSYAKDDAAIRTYQNVGSIKDIFPIIASSAAEHCALVSSDVSKMDASICPTLKNVFFTAFYDGLVGKIDNYGPYKGMTVFEGVAETPLQRAIRDLMKKSEKPKYIIRDPNYGVSFEIELPAYQTGNLITSVHHSYLMASTNRFFFRVEWIKYPESRILTLIGIKGANVMGDDVILTLRFKQGVSLAEKRAAVKVFTEKYEWFFLHVVGLHVKAECSPCFGEFLKVAGYLGMLVPYRERLNAVTDERPNPTINFMQAWSSIKSILHRLLQRGCDVDVMTLNQWVYADVTLGWMPLSVMESSRLSIPPRRVLNPYGLKVSPNMYWHSAAAIGYNTNQDYVFAARSGDVRTVKFYQLGASIKPLPTDVKQEEAMRPTQSEREAVVNITRFLDTERMRLSALARAKLILAERRGLDITIKNNMSYIYIGDEMLYANLEKLANDISIETYFSKFMPAEVRLSNYVLITDLNWVERYHIGVEATNYDGVMLEIPRISAKDSDNTQNRAMSILGISDVDALTTLAGGRLRSLVPRSLNADAVIDLVSRLAETTYIDDALDLAGITRKERFKQLLSMSGEVFKSDYKGLSLRDVLYYNIRLNSATLQKLVTIPDGAKFMDRYKLYALALEQWMMMGAPFCRMIIEKDF